MPHSSMPADELFEGIDDLNGGDAGEIGVRVFGVADDGMAAFHLTVGRADGQAKGHVPTHLSEPDEADSEGFVSHATRTPSPPAPSSAGNRSITSGSWPATSAAPGCPVSPRTIR